MNDALIEGESLELIEEAFRGMNARRDADGWVSVSGRLDRIPGEALMRALHRVEANLPRRIGTTREQHRVAALDEIARQFEVASSRAPERPSADVTRINEARPVERARTAIDVAAEKFHKREPGAARHLSSVPLED